MPNLMNLGQKGPGTVLSDTYQITAPWVGVRVVLSLSIPSNQNTADRSIALTYEWADTETGVYTPTLQLDWQGSGAGKDGSWEPSYTYTVGSWLLGKWVRCRANVPVRTRFGIDLDVVT